MKIIFVCTGNTCRSAMAEGLAKKVVEKKNLDIEVYSAGIFAVNGEHASYNSIAVMKEYDVDIVTHTATPIDEVNLKLEVEVKPKIADSIKQQRVLYDALYNVFTEFKEDTSVKVNKTNKILNQPEFSSVDKMRNILNKFEDKELIQKIKEDESGVNIYIGSENDFDDDISIIKTKYTIDGEEGTIAVIGPKRMEYGRVTTLLNFIKNNLDDYNE